MKKISLFILCNFILHIGFAQNEEHILSKTLSKLNSVNSIEYNVSIHEVSKNTGTNKIDEANCYLEFISDNTLIGTKYQFRHSNGEQVFNGSELFSVMKKEKVVLISQEPTKDQVQSSIFMNFSISELRTLLEKFRTDSTIKIKHKNDTIIKDQNSYHLEIQIPHRYIGRGSELIDAKNSKIEIFKYQIFIDKTSYFPLQFGYSDVDDNGFKTISFSNYKNVKREKDTWSYNRISDEYLRFTFQEYFSRMGAKAANRVGKKAPSWALKDMDNQLVKLSEQESKLILIEFWFPYCKGCVLAVPELNEIRANFNEEDLLIYGVEMTNKGRDFINSYLKKQNVKYPTLYMGKEISQKYGVYAAPTFYLLDQKGLIKETLVGYENGKLISLIDNYLN